MKTFTFIVTSLALATSAVAQTVTLFQDPNFGGASIDINVTIEKCQNLPVDFQRSVSSVKYGALRCGLCHDPCEDGRDLPAGFCVGPRTGDDPVLPAEADNLTVSIFCAGPE